MDTSEEWYLRGERKKNDRSKIEVIKEGNTRVEYESIYSMAFLFTLSLPCLIRLSIPPLFFDSFSRVSSPWVCFSRRLWCLSCLWEHNAAGISSHLAMGVTCQHSTKIKSLKAHKRFVQRLPWLLLLLLLLLRVYIGI